jgi:ferredoxin-NADP reductase
VARDAVRPIISSSGQQSTRTSSQYSLAAAPGVTNGYRIAVKKEPESRGGSKARSITE